MEFDMNHHMQDIDLHPKNEKIPKENGLPERAQVKFQQIENLFLTDFVYAFIVDQCYTKDYPY